MVVELALNLFTLLIINKDKNNGFSHGFELTMKTTMKIAVITKMSESSSP